MRRIIPIILLVAACAHHDSTATDGKATVVRVVDGDTIVVRIGGGDENVRILGIDTPETHKPDTPVECFGPEAAARLTELLPEQSVVRLVRDTEARDHFGRLLAYVYRDSDGMFIDLVMVNEGFAATLSIAPNLAYADELARAEVGARAERRGLWGACGGNHVVTGG